MLIKAKGKRQKAKILFNGKQIPVNDIKAKGKRQKAKIQFNGKQIPVKHTDTLETMLKAHSIENSTPGIAVAVNDRIVKRGEWPTLKIHTGDCIEVVHAVQ